MTRTVILTDGRRLDTSHLTQAQELAYLRRLLGPSYAQFVKTVEHGPQSAPLEEPQQKTGAR